MTPSNAFPLNAPPVIMCDAWGHELWRGVVIGYPGPYSVVIETSTGFKVQGSTSLIRKDADPMDELIVQQMELIDRLNRRHARITEALERYLMARFGARRPLKIDELDLRAVMDEVFSNV